MSQMLVRVSSQSLQDTPRKSRGFPSHSDPLFGITRCRQRLSETQLAARRLVSGTAMSEAHQGPSEIRDYIRLNTLLS